MAPESERAKDDVVSLKAAVNVLLEPVLRLLQGDPHQWSTRPCETCRVIGSIIGQKFGCYKYAAENLEKKHETETA